RPSGVGRAFRAPQCSMLRNNMKYFLSLFLICMSSFSLAWECGSYDKYSQPVEKHLEIATDVFIGTVLEGKLEDSYSIDLKLKVTLPIKGNLKTEVELTTNSEPINDRFYIGGHYIVFLYGSSK